MKIYRLEYNGKGPWYSDLVYRLQYEEAISLLLAPTIDNEIRDFFIRYRDMTGQKFLFGCTSPEKLEKYFQGCFYKLINLGACVIVYEASNVLEDENQCVFIPETKGVSYEDLQYA